MARPDLADPRIRPLLAQLHRQPAGIPARELHAQWPDLQPLLGVLLTRKLIEAVRLVDPQPRSPYTAQVKGYRICRDGREWLLTGSVCRRMVAVGRSGRG